MIGLSADAANIGDFTFANFPHEHPIRRGAPRPDRDTSRRDIDPERQEGRSPEGRRYRVLADLEDIRPADRDSDGLLFPLEKRDQSFKEYMREFVIVQFDRQLQDVGLDRPWYWGHFLNEIDTYHHTQQAGIWSWRNTVWWNPTGGLGKAERVWLEQKYPGWTTPSANIGTSSSTM